MCSRIEYSRCQMTNSLCSHLLIWLMIAVRLNLEYPNSPVCSVKPWRRICSRCAKMRTSEMEKKNQNWTTEYIYFTIKIIALHSLETSKLKINGIYRSNSKTIFLSKTEARMRRMKKSKCVEQLRRNAPSNQNKINFRIQSQTVHRVLKLKGRDRVGKKRAFAIEDQLSWKWSVRRSEESIIYSWTHSRCLRTMTKRVSEAKKNARLRFCNRLDWANGQNRWTVSDVLLAPSDANLHARPSPSGWWQQWRRTALKLSQSNSDRYGNSSARRPTTKRFVAKCRRTVRHMVDAVHTLGPIVTSLRENEN